MIGGDNLPSPVGIGLTDLAIIGRASLSMNAGFTQRYAKVRPSLAKKFTCRAPSDT